MSPLYRAQSEIRAVLAQSDEPEHARHAEDTLSWIIRLKCDAGPALALAALAHDIDAADPATVVRRDDFDIYDEYKAAHARASARILRGILLQCEVAQEVTKRACRLVEMHEFGGDPEANVLRDADCLSCFSVNLPLYLERKGRAETLRRTSRDYARLSQHGRRFFPGIRHEDPRLNRILRQAAAVHAL